MSDGAPEPTECAKCVKGFSIFRSKYYCRRCTETYCDACCAMTSAAGGGGAPIKVCSGCCYHIEQSCGHPIYQLLGHLAPNYFDKAIQSGCISEDVVRSLTTNDMLRLLKNCGVTDSRHHMYLLARLSNYGAGEADYQESNQDSEESYCESAGLTSIAPSTGRRRTLSMRSFPERDRLDRMMETGNRPVSMREEQLTSLFCAAEQKVKERCFRSSLRQCLTRLTHERFLRKFWGKLYLYRMNSRIMRGFLLNTNSTRVGVMRRRKQFLRGDHHEEQCSMCNIRYTFFRREHHCRLCYNSCCSACSPKTSDVRQCHSCCAAPEVLLPNMHISSPTHSYATAPSVMSH